MSNGFKHSNNVSTRQTVNPGNLKTPLQRDVSALEYYSMVSYLLCKASECPHHANSWSRHQPFMIPSTAHTQSYLLAYLQMSSQSTVDNMLCLGVDLAQLVQMLTSLYLHKTEKRRLTLGSSSNIATTRRNPLHRNLCDLKYWPRLGAAWHGGMLLGNDTF